MANYKVDMRVEVVGGPYGNKAKIVLDIINEESDYVVDHIYDFVYEPKWFERVILKKTFENKIKNKVAFYVRKAAERIEKLKKQDELRDTIKEFVDGLSNRTP